MEFNKKEYVLKDGQKLIVRMPKIGDEEGLISLIQTVDSETKFLAREPGEFKFTIEQETEFIKNSINNENSLFLIGEINGEIIASCSVGVISNNGRFCHRAMMGIVVKKKCWNNGIGKNLIQQCINWCKENNIEQLELDAVSQNSRAVSMYKSLGFDIYGTKKHAMKYSDGSYADEYFMCLFLNNI